MHYNILIMYIVMHYIFYNISFIPKLYFQIHFYIKNRLSCVLMHCILDVSIITNALKYYVKYNAFIYI